MSWLYTPRRRPRIAVAASFAIAASSVAFALASPAAAIDTSSDVVVSEVYGGGGNSGATLTNDFIELYNRGAVAHDLTGWSVQYASSTGTSWSVTPLAGSIAPGGHYLVQEGAGAGGTTPLPTPDATGSIAMSATNGKIALAANSTSLTTLACANVCSAAAGVIDFVGFGAANDAAGSPTPALTNTTSAQRTPPAANTGNNAADFITGAPAPENSGSGGPPDPCDVQPQPNECIPGFYTIQDIQGDGFLSPLAGVSLIDVAGTVTAVATTGSARGFWFQQATPDPNRSSASSGLFAFTGGATPAVSAGDAVLVTGAVSEFRAGGPTSSNLSVTEISPSAITIVSSGNALPAPIVLGPASVPGTYAPTVPGGNIETLPAVDPTRSVLEFYEAHEGMRAEVDDARVVGPTNAFGEMFVTSKPTELATPRGGTYLAGYDAVPTGRLLVSSVTTALPTANVGDQLLGATIGAIDWSQFGGYELVATQLGAYADHGLTGTVAEPADADQLSVATYNVENLAPSDPQEKFDRLATGVVQNLRSPDVIAVEEVQDNSGAVSDGTVASDQTLTKLTQAIASAGGPTYQWAVIDPVDGADGGQPGGNIRVAFLYNADRVTFVSRPGGDATTAVTVSTGSDGTPQLSISPGRVDPTNAAWTSSRKPLAGEFVFQGRKVIIVANHFNSKGGDQNADGPYQPPTRSSEVQRTQQATVLNDFVDQVLAADPRANVVLAGDFNDYQFSSPILTLTDNGATLTDLINTLPENERYTYVFNGTSQVLDHIFVSKPIPDVEYEVIHVNAEFSNQASDHDPQVARIRPLPPPTPPGTIVATPIARAGGKVGVALLGWTPRTNIAISLDGTTPLTTARTDRFGNALLSVTIPSATTAGSHRIVATNPSGGSSSAPVFVLRR